MGRGQILVPFSMPSSDDVAAPEEEAVDAVGTVPAAEPAPASAPKSERKAAEPPQAAAQGGLFGSEAPADETPAGPKSDEEVERINAALAAIQEKAEACVECKLAETRNTVVFGCGSARSGIVFVGEAPGADEDAQGIPFVGRAGKLLDRILRAMEIPRDDVYICNVLKCRPPKNRDPEADEVASCTPFLVKQLEILEPAVICCLGLHAARRLLNTTAPMGKLRGTVMRYRGIPAMATYHPAALLRNPNLKPAAWEDFQKLQRMANGETV